MIRFAVAIATEDAMPNAFAIWRGIDESIGKAAQLGYDGVELALKTADQVDETTIEELLTTHGLSCPCLSTGQVFAGLDLCFTATDVTKRKEVVRVFDAIVSHLDDRGILAENAGSDSTEIVCYPIYACKVAGAVARGEFERGILVCSTGIGMSIAANKIKGIRASQCTSHYEATMTRQHNDSNVLCLGGKTTGIFEILHILDAWLENDFAGGRHDISLKLIRDIEAEVGCGVPVS